MPDRTAYFPDYAVPPGESLQEALDDRRMSQAELARRTNRPLKTINEIVNGKSGLTPETAIQLARVLDIPTSFWTNLERNYREDLARIGERKKLSASVKWIKRFPIKELIARNRLPNTNDKIDLVEGLLRFFAVGSIEAWERKWGHAAVAFKQSAAYEIARPAVAAWVRIGELRAETIECEPYSEEKFREALNRIRDLTTDSPENFYPQLLSECVAAGVALVLERELPKTRVFGASHWLRSDKAIIQLSLRYKHEDHMWFSFFHEAGHLLLHPKKDTFVNDGSPDECELEANQFATDKLIPPDSYEVFKASKPRSRGEVERFAQIVGIAPGIVLGRLQREEVIHYSHMNELKRSFMIVEN